MILKSIRVQSEAQQIPFLTTKGPATEAFNEEEATYLSETLSKAFAHAQPQDWIIFEVTRPRQHGLTEVTSGGWFVEGPQLHLVLANYRNVVSAPSVRDLLSLDPLRPNGGPFYDLVPGLHQTMVQRAGSTGELLSSAPSELAIAYKSLLLGEPVPSRKAQPGPAPAQAEAQPDRVPPRLSIEERLQTLKRLREQGLITEEEFRDKKKNLLDQF